MNSTYFLSQFLPLYTNICAILEYNCHSENVCNSQSCAEGAECVQRKFPEPGEKPYFCRYDGVQLFWKKVEVYRGY